MIPKAKFQLPKCSGIYLITCTVTDKVYVGSTNDLYRRWRSHRSQLRAGLHSNPHLQNAWNKYGESAFTFSVLEKCDDAKLIEREQHYLNEWLPFKDRGFNIAKDAKSPTTGRQLSAETRAKISASNTGKKHSEETLKKLRGRKLTPEQSAKLSALRKGRKHTPEWNAKIGAAGLGRTMSLESRSKIREAKSGLYIVTTSDGIEIKVYNLRQFCRDNNLCQGHMSDVVNGKRNHHKGYKARRIERDGKA